MHLLWWRRRKKPYSFNVILLFLMNLQQAISRQFVGPVRRLQCMTCRAVNGDTTQLDQFRVRQNLHEPWCDMELVECAIQQDSCVTVSMQVGPDSFWIGSGCDQRVNYDLPADRDGCADMQTFSRVYQSGRFEERLAFQQVCICSEDMCNYSASSKSKWFLSFCLILGSLLMFGHGRS